MDLLGHFTNSNENGLFVFLLKDDQLDQFLAKLPKLYEDCFVSSGDLQKLIETLNSSRKQELSGLLPTEGKIKSGDFGEILAYLMLKEIYKDQKIDGPKKWRWKQAQDMPAPYSDVILFSIKDENNYSKDDLLISAESKMKATKDGRNNPVENSIKGAVKDHVSRMAHSLNWMKKKYKEELLKENTDKDKVLRLIKNITRFIESEKLEYKKKVKALAFVDKEFLEDEKNKTVIIPTVQGMNIEIFLVGIKDLKEIYEKVYSEILNYAE